MEEIKPVVKEKKTFDYREKSILIPFYWNFWTIGILTRSIKKSVFNGMFFFLGKVFPEDLYDKKNLW